MKSEKNDISTISGSTSSLQQVHLAPIATFVVGNNERYRHTEKSISPDPKNIEKTKLTCCHQLRDAA
jgi:hypothetical protein